MRRVRLLRVALSTWLALWLAFAPTRATAQALPSQGDAERAIQRFEEARALVEKNDCKDAIPKFLESLQLQFTVGALLNIANCYEKLGMVASAWIRFRQAENFARDKGDNRVNEARTRAAALEPIVPKLLIKVEPGSDVPALEVRRDGDVLAREAWGQPLPIDPGRHDVDAALPGKKPWHQAVTLTATGETATVTVGPFEEESTTIVLAQQPGLPQVDADSVAARSRVQIIGGTLFGVGVVGAGLGIVFGAIVLGAHGELKNQDCLDGSYPNCVVSPNRLQQATNARNAEKNLAVAANISVGVGIVFLLTGAALYLSAPKVRKQASQDREPVRLTPIVAQGIYGVLLGRAW
jgi:hypothetical protein